MSRLTLAGLKDFDEIYELMETSFPDIEHRTKEDQRDLFKDSAYQVWIVRQDNGTLGGFLSTWDFGDFRFAEHFAVNPALRGHGLGKEMLADWLDSSCLPAVLEVELPENEIAKRRIGFYERLGFRLNTFPYLQPPMQKGKDNLPLYIMSYPAALTAEDFLPWKKILYTRVYKTDAFSGC